MTAYIHRGILIVAAGRADDANNTFAAMGWGPNNFRVRLSAAPGGGPVTNYGLSGVMTEADKTMLIDAIDTGVLPAVDWIAAGITETHAKNAFGQMTYAFGTNGVDPLDQLDTELQGKSLTRVPDDPI